MDRRPPLIYDDEANPLILELGAALYALCSWNGCEPRIRINKDVNSGVDESCEPEAE